MSKVVPSQIVEFISKAFRGIDDAETPPRQRKPCVHGWSDGSNITALLDLLDKLPAKFINAIPSDNQWRYYAALGDMRYAKDLWIVPKVPDTLNPWKDYKINSKPEFNGRTSIEFTRDVLFELPDQVPQLETSELLFLKNDPSFQLGIRQDVSTSYKLFDSHEYKASIVMAGSVIEALLVWLLQNQEYTLVIKARDEWNAENANSDGKNRTPIKSKKIEEWNLDTLINIADYLKQVSKDTVSSLHLSREYRNLIHPGRAMRKGLHPTRGSALNTLGGMERLIEEINGKSDKIE